MLSKRVRAEEPNIFVRRVIRFHEIGWIRLIRFHIFETLIPFIRFNLRNDEEYCKNIAAVCKDFRNLFGSDAYEWAHYQQIKRIRISCAVYRWGACIRYDLNDFTHELAIDGNREYIKFKATEMKMTPRIMLMRFSNEEEYSGPVDTYVKKFGVAATIIWESTCDEFATRPNPRRIMWREKAGLLDGNSTIHIFNKWTHETSRVNLAVKVKRFVRRSYTRDEESKMAWSLEPYFTWTVKEYSVATMTWLGSRWRDQEMRKWREQWLVGNECFGDDKEIEYKLNKNPNDH